MAKADAKMAARPKWSPRSDHPSVRQASWYLQPSVQVPMYSCSLSACYFRYFWQRKGNSGLLTHQTAGLQTLSVTIPLVLAQTSLSWDMIVFHATQRRRYVLQPRIVAGGPAC